VNLTEVAEAGHAHHAGTLVEQSVELVHVHVGVADQVEDDGRIDIAGTSTHHEAFERGQAHGGLDWLAGNFGGGGSAVADMQHDLLEAFSRLTDDARHHGGDELVGGAVGAVTADVVLVGDFLVQRVGACGLRQLEEEGGIEHEDLRDVRQERAHDFSTLGFRTVVQRREHGEVLDLVDGLVGDQSRVREDGTTLHHAVTNSHDAGLVQLRTELVEEAEHALQTLLVVVDRLFQLMLLAVELVLVVAVNRLADLLDQAGSNTFTGFKINQLILDRAGTGIDDKDGFRHCGHPPCVNRCAACATFQTLDYSLLATK
jgi:hypothetical protein